MCDLRVILKLFASPKMYFLTWSTPLRWLYWDWYPYKNFWTGGVIIGAPIIHQDYETKPLVPTMEKPFCKWKSCCILRIKKKFRKTTFYFGINSKRWKIGKNWKTEKCVHMIKIGGIRVQKAICLVVRLNLWSMGECM